MEQVNAVKGGADSLINILSDRAHNSKWINFARKELRGNKKSVNARYKEAEDYVEDVKLKILSGEIVLNEENGDVDNFICGIIKNDINSELRKSPVMVSLRDREDRVDEGEDEEESFGRNAEECGAESDENLVVMFEDPFEERVDKMGAWEIMQICYALLEKEEPEMLVVFDERAKGHANREIAKYLHVKVEEVENLWKRVVRLLRKNIFLYFS
jgi:DNA-directed RNA polymerase specialized sigma24 family protein